MSYTLNYSEYLLIFNSYEKAASCCEKINSNILAYISSKLPDADIQSFPVSIDDFTIERWNNITQLKDYSENSEGVLVEKWYIRDPYFFNSNLVEFEDYDEKWSELSSIYIQS